MMLDINEILKLARYKWEQVSAHNCERKDSVAKEQCHQRQLYQSYGPQNPVFGEHSPLYSELSSVSD